MPGRHHFVGFGLRGVLRWSQTEDCADQRELRGIRDLPVWKSRSDRCPRGAPLRQGQYLYPRAFIAAPDLHQILESTAHRPYPLPRRPWRLRQQWHDLLFAHWPIPATEIQRLLPPGLEADTFDGSAWIGVIPFWMDHVVTRSVGEHTFSVPTTRSFPELNLRTYVRSRVSGLSGVFFFSLDCASPLAVFGARTLFHLPYFPASMQRTVTGSATEYRSRRLFTGTPTRYEATFGPILGAEVLPQSQPGSFEYFVSERYCLFTPFAGRMLVGHIHHLPWPLVPAEAEIRLNEIPAAHGIRLPGRAPILHFSSSLNVFLWALREDSAGDSTYG